MIRKVWDVNYRCTRRLWTNVSIVFEFGSTFLPGHIRKIKTQKSWSSTQKDKNICNRFGWARKTTKENCKTTNPHSTEAIHLAEARVEWLKWKSTKQSVAARAAKTSRLRECNRFFLVPFTDRWQSQRQSDGIIQDIIHSLVISVTDLCIIMGFRSLRYNRINTVFVNFSSVLHQFRSTSWIGLSRSAELEPIQTLISVHNLWSVRFIMTDYCLRCIIPHVLNRFHDWQIWALNSFIVLFRKLKWIVGRSGSDGLSAALSVPAAPAMHSVKRKPRVLLIRW